MCGTLETGEIVNALRGDSQAARLGKACAIVRRVLEGRVLEGRVLEGRVLEGRVLEGRVLEECVRAKSVLYKYPQSPGVWS